MAKLPYTLSTELTDREREVARLREDEGLSLAKIAARLETSKGSVSTSWRMALAKRRQERNPRSAKTPRPPRTGLEFRDPAKAAEVLDLGTDPLVTLTAAAKQAGLPRSTVQAFMRRMGAKLQPALEEVREVKRANFTKKLWHKADTALDYIDEMTLAASPAKDLAITIGVLVDKARMIEGDPGSRVMKPEDRRKLNELAEALNAEMKRRKIIDVTPLVVTE